MKYQSKATKARRPDHRGGVRVLIFVCLVPLLTFSRVP
jgi:hypothetical protein